MSKLTLQDFNRAKKALEKANVPMNTFSIPYITSDMCAKMNCFADCPTPCTAAPVPRKEWGKKQEKENTMVTETDLELQSRRYLRDQLFGIVEQKRNAARETFGLTDDPAPATLQEFVDRIKAGTIVLPKNADDKETWKYRSVYDMGALIRFRDPAKVEDTAGFKAFEKKLDAACDATATKIFVLPAKDGLAELEAFKAATFQ